MDELLEYLLANPDAMRAVLEDADRPPAERTYLAPGGQPYELEGVTAQGQRTPTIGPQNSSVIMDALFKHAPGVARAITAGQRALRPVAGANPITALASLLDLENPLGAIDGPGGLAADAVSGALRRGGDEMEKVVAAAVRDRGGRVFQGAHHGHASNVARIEMGLGDKEILPRMKDGFVTSFGRFVDRDEAGRIAFTAKQKSKKGWLSAQNHEMRDVFESDAGRPNIGPEGAAGDKVGIQFRPQPRGVFDRSVPDIQGQMPADPRLLPPGAKPRARQDPVSELAKVVANSPVVRGGMMNQMNLGMGAGGPSWYNLGPVKADLDARGPGAISFLDFNLLGGAASANNSVPNEFSAMTIANYGRKRGLPRKEAVKHYLQQTGYPKKPAMMGMHYDGGIKATQAGEMLPTDPFSESWKIPSYVNHRLGGGGLFGPMDAPGMTPALDTHERRAMLLLAADDPEARFILDELHPGLLDDPKAVLPIRNNAEYAELSNIYTDAAKELGLPTAGAAQAARWLGGWDVTGLKSPPVGDFVQLLEDQLLFSAQQRGLDDSPQGLQSLWGKITEGDEFLLPYAPTKKNPYMPLKPQTK